MALITLIILAGATLPSPLYALWERQYDFGPGIVTLVFAAQGLFSILTLLLLGRASDERGRRPVILVALGLLVASSAVFYSAAGLAMLLIARALSGIALGLAQGTAAATLLELQAHRDAYRAARITMFASNGGLGAGGLAAGLIAQYGTLPTKLPFLLYGAALALALILMMLVPETAPRQPCKLSIRPRIGWPANGAALFAAVGGVAFSAFAMQSMFTGLSSSLLAGTLHDAGPALAGASVFFVFAASTGGQLISRGRNLRALIFSGLACIVVGLSVVTAGFASKEVAEFFAGAVVGGIGAGMALVGAVAAVNQLAPPLRRGEMLSSYNLMAYTGVILPVTGFGFLAEGVGPTGAAASFTALLFCVIVFAVIVLAGPAAAEALQPIKLTGTRK